MELTARVALNPNADFMADCAALGITVTFDDPMVGKMVALDMQHAEINALRQMHREDAGDVSFKEHADKLNAALASRRAIEAELVAGEDEAEPNGIVCEEAFLADLEDPLDMDIDLPRLTGVVLVSFSIPDGVNILSEGDQLFLAGDGVGAQIELYDGFSMG